MVSVTVASATRRVDLLLPDALPVVELVHELARSVGLLDPATAHGGYRLVTAGGRELIGDVGLAGQGIQDGALLTITAGVDDDPPRLYDDVAEAMADVVERDLAPWDPDLGRPVAVTTAVLLAAVGALALVMDGSVAAGAVACTVALCLITAAVVLPRVRRDARAGVGLTWLGTAYAAVAGFVLAPLGPVFVLPIACAGAGAAIAGLTCLLGICEDRFLVTPPVMVGAVFAAIGSATRALPVDPELVLTTVLMVVVMTGSFVPTLALGVTGILAEQPPAALETPVDVGRVSADAYMAHQIVIAASVTAGLLLLVVAPFAVSLGVAGTCLAFACSVIVLLRTRRHHASTQVQVGLVSGITGVLSVAISAVWLHPSWRPSVAVLLAAAGIAAFAATLFPSTPSVRRVRLGDLVESAALLATLPLLLTAAGVFASIRG